MSDTADQLQHILLGLTRLKSLGASEILTSLAESAMNPELKEHWLNHTSELKTTPPAEKVIEFLRLRADRAEGVSITASNKHQYEKNKQNKHQKKKPQNTSLVAAGSPAVAAAAAAPPTVSGVGPAVVSQIGKKEYPPCKYSCPLCPENHYAFHCSIFKNYAVQQKKIHVATHSLCYNCLKPGQTLENCRSTFRCFTCKAKHSSFLHEDATALSSPALGLASASTIIPDGLLMTATVLVTGKNGKTVSARAFIDGGSSVTLISNKLKTALALKPSGGSLAIDGVAGFVGETQHPIVNVTISSSYDKKWERNISAIAMPKVIRDLPLKDASVVRDMPHLQGLTLADDLYHKMGPVDVLLGLNVFPHIFKDGVITGPPNTPVAWHTVFGWTVLGVFEERGPSQAITASTLVVEMTQASQTSDNLLTRFWRMEEPQCSGGLLSPEEQRVEDHFQKTHKYMPEEKRYVVSLPKTLGEMTLGESRSRALHRAQANERSLLRKQRWPAFQAVMAEYLELGHATVVSPQEMLLPPSQSYYMPVHSVHKEASSLTKIRAVFDASTPSASGVSLNDLLAVGPTLQPTLEQTLLRFRKYGVAISGDISKMYREILLAPEDKNLHRFL